MSTIRDLDIEVIGGEHPDAYLYVGSGDHCVLLCDWQTPKWKNAIGLTPDNARKLAAALVRMADQAEAADESGEGGGVSERRIEWRQGQFSRRGRAGRLDLFGIHWGTKRQDAMWSLSTVLPVHSKLLGQHYVTREDAEVAAERLLAAFIKRISAPTQPDDQEA